MTLGSLAVLVVSTHLSPAWAEDETLSSPTDWQWTVMFLCGFLFFMGDFLCIAAYGLGTSVPTVTICLMGIPVFANAIQSLRTQKIPTVIEMSAFVLVVISVILIVVCNDQKSQQP